MGAPNEGGYDTNTSSAIPAPKSQKAIEPPKTPQAQITAIEVPKTPLSTDMSVKDLKVVTVNLMEAIRDTAHKKLDKQLVVVDDNEQSKSGVGSFHGPAGLHLH